MIYYPESTCQTQTPGNTQIGSATIVGAVATAVVKTTINAKKVSEGSLSIPEALRDTVKGSAQGAVATATVATIQEMTTRPNPSTLNAVAVAAMGIVGVYAIEKIADSLSEVKEA